ncbi:MAG: GTPase Era [Anaerolineales bacterium]|nr:GTPase Era [Anaerolineales bacterium]
MKKYKKFDTTYKSGFVAVVGQPNVGKSTLLNRLLGQKVAAVSYKPQTTRRQQLGILTTDEYQLIFVDTPGLNLQDTVLGKQMNNEVYTALDENDVVLFMIDGSSTPMDEDVLLADTISEMKHETPVILAANKVDLLNEEELDKNIEAYQALVPKALLIKISALTGKNVETLIAMIVELMPNSPALFPEDQVTDAYERDIAADLIREAALEKLRDEVPHSIAVRIDEYTERGEDGAYIEATLFVERDSQKGIVIGKGGETLKKIGEHARREIEKMSGRNVFLRTRVKVRKDWRNDENFLNQFGFRQNKKGK